MSVKDAREAEAEAGQIVKVKAKSRFGITPSSTDVDSINLDETAGIANYMIRGSARLIVQPSGFLRSEEAEEHSFQMRLDATDLKLLGFEWTS